MLSTSKNVLLPRHNHLLATGAADPSLWISSECQVDSMVVSWRIVAFLPSGVSPGIGQLTVWFQETKYLKALLYKMSGKCSGPPLWCEDVSNSSLSRPWDSPPRRTVKGSEWPLKGQDVCNIMQCLPHFYIAYTPNRNKCRLASHVIVDETCRGFTPAWSNDFPINQRHVRNSKRKLFRVSAASRSFSIKPFADSDFCKICWQFYTHLRNKICYATHVWVGCKSSFQVGNWYARRSPSLLSLPVYRSKHSKVNWPFERSVCI